MCRSGIHRGNNVGSGYEAARCRRRAATGQIHHQIHVAHSAVLNCTGRQTDSGFDCVGHAGPRPHRTGRQHVAVRVGANREIDHPPGVSVGPGQPGLPAGEHLHRRGGREIEPNEIDIAGCEGGERHRRRHPEVAAATTAQCPEQIRVAAGGYGDHVAAGQHYRRGLQGVAG